MKSPADQTYGELLAAARAMVKADDAWQTAVRMGVGEAAGRSLAIFHLGALVGRVAKHMAVERVNFEELTLEGSRGGE